MRVQPAVFAVVATLLIMPPAVSRGVMSALGDGVHVLCAQPAPTALECDFRLLQPAPLADVSVSVNDVALTSVELAPRTTAEGEHTVLFLVDTSDPARQRTVKRTIEHIAALLAKATEAHSFGLASFDTRLRIEAPLGASPEQVLAAAQTLRAVGRTTELYRNTLEAVRILGAYPAQRRALFLFSDGLAEDTAYYHQDVVREARAQDVVIFGLGYARSVSLSVALQTLRRLSEETGGIFVAANAQEDLPAAFLEDPYKVLDNGERLSVDLWPAVGAGMSGEQDVAITWTTDRGTATARVPVTLPPLPPVEPAPVEALPPPEPPPALEAAPASPAPVADPAESNRGYRYLVLAAVALAVVLLGVILVRASRPGRTPQARKQAAMPKQTFAYLESQNGSGTRHAINSAVFRIGRHSDNELSIDDPSISRYHAEIRRRRDGAFTITDLDSMNGVFVNRERVKEATLAEGDGVELGDLALRFSIVAGDAVLGEETIMLKTSAPSLSMSGGSKGVP